MRNSGAETAGPMMPKVPKAHCQPGPAMKASLKYPAIQMTITFGEATKPSMSARFLRDEVSATKILDGTYRKQCQSELE